MTDDEIIAVVQAHKEGKKIQFVEQWVAEKEINWKDLPYQHNWNFASYDYRIVPEPRKPRECWIDEESVDGGDLNIFGYKPDNSAGMVHFREVLE